MNFFQNVDWELFAVQLCLNAISFSALYQGKFITFWTTMALGHTITLLWWLFVKLDYTELTYENQ